MLIRVFAQVTMSTTETSSFGKASGRKAVAAVTKTAKAPGLAGAGSTPPRLL